MKKQLFVLLSSFLLAGCTQAQGNPKDEKEKEKENTNEAYGAFLGRSENDTTGFENYKYISIELDEYQDSTIKELDTKGIYTFAYLNVGSLENYRDYYDQFKHLSIGVYEDWEDEVWINVSDSSWQNFVVNNLAKSFKQRGAYGVYMDNVDVYTIAKEKHLNYESFALGLKNIIKGVSNLGLKVMINGGSEFLDDMNDNNDNIFNSVWGYHQEEVFSLIEDYDKNIFGKQDEEDSSYYKEVASFMKKKGKEIFFLEYTKDNNLISQIKSYCESKNYHYYVSSTINLD